MQPFALAAVAFVPLPALPHHRGGRQPCILRAAPGLWLSPQFQPRSAQNLGRVEGILLPHEPFRCHHRVAEGPGRAVALDFG